MALGLRRKTIMSILCSAGHTNIKGQDRGAAGNGFVEGDLTVELRDAVAAHLRELGESVLEDGFDGENQPLKKALELARQASVAVEFHWNAGPPTATGIEVLSKPKHKELAQTIAQAIHQATAIGLRGDSGWKADNSGQHHRLAFAEAGGLIVEVCFISNAADMARYRENFEAVAKGIAGVLAATVKA
jgi:N-acetylmuramoyl-L-alanine amidase